MNAATKLGQQVGIKAACQACGINRSTYYRLQQVDPENCSGHLRPKPARALSDEEQQVILDILHSDRFMDAAPYQVYAALLDNGVYLCFIRTMYRILERNKETQERRNQVRRPHYTKPELLATRPNQVWSWDITKLKSPAKWTYYYLYVIIDIFSRYVVGWMIAHKESTDLAKSLIEETCLRQNIKPNQLTLHADRGSSMKSKGVEQLLIDLEVKKTHSRPYVSNDNPYSEAQFKTMKYRPEFPASFGSIEDARTFAKPFFGWYNHDHYHSGIALLTPFSVHAGSAEKIIDHRQGVLMDAFNKNPERFNHKVPMALQLPDAAWINPPVSKDPIACDKSDHEV